MPPAKGHSESEWVRQARLRPRGPLNKTCHRIDWKGSHAKGREGGVGGGQWNHVPEEQTRPLNAHHALGPEHHSCKQQHPKNPRMARAPCEHPDSRRHRPGGRVSNSLVSLPTGRVCLLIYQTE